MRRGAFRGYNARDERSRDIGPKIYRPPRTDLRGIRGSGNDVERGRALFESSNAESGNLVEAVLERERDVPRVGILRVQLDLVSGEVAKILIDGREVDWHTIQSFKVLLGRKTAPASPAEVRSED